MSQRKWGWLLLGVCSFCLVAGWTGAPEFWRIGGWEVSIVLSWLMLVWIVALVSPPVLRWHPAAGAWICWVFWTGVSSALSGDFGHGLAPWAFNATCVLLFLLAHAWWGGAHRRAWVVGLWGIVPLAVLLWPRNQFACLLATASAACVGIWMGPRRGVPGWLRELALAAICALAFVLFYGSWGECLGFFFAASLCAIHAGKQDRWMIPALFGASVIAWLLLLAYGNISGVSGWLKIVSDHSVTGLGPGMILSAPDLPLPPHMLRMATEMGWVGLGLYLCAIWRSLPNNFKSLGWEGRAAAAALYALVAQSFVEGVPGDKEFQIIFFSAVACASNWARAKEEPGLSRLVEERHGWIKPLWAVAPGLALCLAAMGLQRAKAVAAAAVRSPQPQIRIAGLQRLAGLEPLNANARMSLARELYFADSRKLGAPLARLDEAICLEPRNPVFLELKAELFPIVGDWQRSAEWAGKASKIAPWMPEPHLMLAESLAQLGDRQAAKKELDLAKRAYDSSLEGSVARIGWDQRRYDRVGKVIEHATTKG